MEKEKEKETAQMGAKLFYFIKSEVTRLKVLSLYEERGQLLMVFF